MATYTITASAVVPPATISGGGLAGEALAAGDVLYLLATDGKLYLADSNDTAAKAAAIGVAVNTAAAGQPVSYATGGEITVDAGLFTIPGVGGILVLSPTAGKAMDVANLLAADYVTILGWVTAANKFMLAITRSGVVKP